eukprot:TRINITY_DN6312_c0_g1_i2.p1 TRINITY_DN6312_c0_g1~~TRINITY_DN6312_c0_g1_i2.p1  ORF type:complete len:831 (+),score=162.42 TRINITY_DN6312_c0_g1_i2:59-2551(+)
MLRPVVLAVALLAACRADEGETCGAAILSTDTGNVTTTGSNASCSDYEGYAHATTAMAVCASKQMAAGLGHRGGCMCYLEMVKCTRGSSCAEATAFCKVEMEAAGCPVMWCDGGAQAGEEVVEVAYRTTGRADAAATWARLAAALTAPSWEPGVPPAVITMETIDVNATLEPTIAWRGDVADLVTVSVTLSPDAALPSGVAPYYTRMLQDLTYVDAFRSAAGVIACEGCAERVTRSCMNFVYPSDALPATPGSAEEDSCGLYPTGAAPPPAVATQCVAEKEQMGYPNASHCLCYLGFAQCVAESGCNEGRQYCEAVMEGAGCDPSWCTEQSDPPLATASAYTIYKAARGAVDDERWAGLIADRVTNALPLRWVQSSLYPFLMFGVEEKYVGAWVWLPVNSTKVPRGIADVMKAEFEGLAADASFRSAGQIASLQRVPELSCYDSVYNMFESPTADNATDTNSCGAYSTYPLPEAPGKLVDTKQDVCAKDGWAKGFSNASTCLCYVSMARCTSFVACDEGREYCRAVMTAAGCDPGWCTMSYLWEPQVAEVTYDVTAAATKGGLETEVTEALADVLAIENLDWVARWVGVTPEEAAMTSVMTVRVALPAWTRFPVSIRAALQQQLEDFALSPAFRMRTGVEALSVTPAPPTPAPPTPGPPTSIPATHAPDTPSPATAVPHTPAPPTSVPATRSPGTASPATPSPATPAPTLTSVTTTSTQLIPTGIPATTTPVTPSPPTLAPPTSIPATRSPKTPSPATPQPVHPVPRDDSNVPHAVAVAVGVLVAVLVLCVLGYVVYSRCRTQAGNWVTGAEPELKGATFAASPKSLPAV